MKKFFKKIKSNKELICILLLLLIAIFYTLWTIPGIIEGHDLKFHLSRILGISERLKSGDIFAYVHNGPHGLGYANGIFYGNLMLYLPAVLSIFMNVITAYKIEIFVVNLITVYSMYYSVKCISKSRKAGMIASILYAGCAYRICDLVLRAALGEVLALAFLPLAFLGFYNIMYDDGKKWWLLGASYAIIIQCHIITTFILTVLLFIIFIFNLNIFLEKKNKFKLLIYAVLLFLGLSASFVFPFIEGYLSNDLLVKHTVTDLSSHAKELTHVFVGIGRDASFIPGIGILLLAIIPLRFKINTKKISANMVNFCDTCIIAGISSLLLTTNIFPWEGFDKLIGFIQFPWRLNTMSCSLICMADAIILYEYLYHNNKNTINRIWKIALVCVCSIIPYFITYTAQMSSPYLKLFKNYHEDYYISQGEYLLMNADLYTLKPFENLYLVNSALDYKTQKKGTTIIFEYKDNTRKSEVQMPLLAYKGYSAKSLKSNKKYPISKSYLGLATIILDDKSDKILISYTGTIIQKISIAITYLTISTICAINIKKYIKKKRLTKKC